jgi:hypothetical protein
MESKLGVIFRRETKMIIGRTFSRQINDFIIINSYLKVLVLVEILWDLSLYKKANNKIIKGRTAFI